MYGYQTGGLQGVGGSCFIINSGNVIGIMYGYNTCTCGLQLGGGGPTSELINVHEDFFHSIVYYTAPLIICKTDPFSCSSFRSASGLFNKWLESRNCCSSSDGKETSLVPNATLLAIAVSCNAFRYQCKSQELYIHRVVDNVPKYSQRRVPLWILYRKTRWWYGLKWNNF